MNDLIDKHDPLPYCDCHQCALVERDRLRDLVWWAYAKLHMREFSKLEDALKLDEMKLLLEHGI
jgi:hypothetical protein